MERLGTDFSARGSVLSQAELENQRKKRGECVTCGRKCFHKKLFKMIPLTVDGEVMNGRCLNCKPLDDNKNAPTPSSRPASREDLARFRETQSSLALGGGSGSRSSKRSGTRTQKSSRNLGKQASNRTVSSGASMGSASGEIPIRSKLRTSSEERSVASGDGSDHNPQPPPSPSGSLNRGYSSRSLSPTAKRRGYSSRTKDYRGGSARSDDGEYLVPESARSSRDTGSNGHYKDDRSYDEYNNRYNQVPESHPRMSEDSYGRRPSNEGEYVGGPRMVSEDESSYYAAMAQKKQPPDYRQAYAESSQHSFRGSNRSIHSSASARDDAYSASRRNLLDRDGSVRYAQESSLGNSSRSIHSNQQLSMHSGGVGNTFLNQSHDDSFGDSSRSSFHTGTVHDQQRESYLYNDDQVSLSHHSAARSYSQRHMGAQGNLLDSQTSSSMVSMTVASRDNAGLDRVRAAGTDFVEIVNVLLDHPDSAAVQAMGLQELSNLHLSPADNDTFAHIGAIQVIVSAMKAFPMDVELQIAGCRAMWNASGTRRNQIAFVEAGALNAILMAMNNYLQDPDVQEQAMATLANVAAVESNVQEMIERGVLASIVEAMDKHAENSHVIMKGCSCITNMSSHVTLLKRTIMEMGGGGAVVIGMVMHPDNPLLQDKALRALRNLSANCDENKLELAGIGGIDSVISAMQVHRDVPGVQESGAWTLSNLAGNPDNKALIGEYGGVDVTIRAMWVHTEDVKVQEWCCRAIFTLSLDTRNASLIQDVGGISAVVNAMQAHVDNPVIQEVGCAVLCNLAMDVRSKMRIVDEEALDAIVLAMVIHTEDVKVQERGCQTLLQIAILENIKALQASNVGEIVQNAAARFPQECGDLAGHLLNAIDTYTAEYNNAHS